MGQAPDHPGPAAGVGRAEVDGDHLADITRPPWCRVVVDEVRPARRVAAQIRVHEAPCSRAASVASTAGNSTLFSLWTCKWVSASISASAAYRAW